MATPLTASKFVEILVAEGVVVKTPHSGWPDHERDSATGKTFGPVHGVVIHHTAGLNVGDYVYNGTSALPGPLCHGYIRKDGAVEMCSAGRANHAGGGDPAVLTAVENESYGDTPPAPQYHEGSTGAADGNDPFYGFECENLGDGKDPWPDVQYRAIVKAATAICRYYGWSEKSAIGHKEWSDWKSDPTFSMIKFRADVKAALALPAGAWPDTQEEDVALTDAEIKKIADAVWADDVVPASEPPYGNSDYDTNKTWSAKYALGDAVLKPRQVKAAVAALDSKVDDLKAQVAALQLGGVDLDALAAKVADELAKRLEN